MIFVRLESNFIDTAASVQRGLVQIKAGTSRVSVCPSEMVESMKKVASMDVELTVEERNLLSVAYKNVIGARRASWRIISSLEQKEENKGGEDKLKMIREYRKTVRLKFCCLQNFGGSVL